MPSPVRKKVQFLMVREDRDTVENGKESANERESTSEDEVLEDVKKNAVEEHKVSNVNQKETGKENELI